MTTTFIETLDQALAGISVDPGRARNLLVKAGAQFVEAAISRNPDGPVQMITELTRTDVTYDVVIGEPNDGGRMIWHAVVTFGADDRHHAGGAAFVQAARTQEAVAQAALTLLEASR